MVPSEKPVHIHPFILSGGAGKRLWPLSRKSYPKQFHPLIGENSLLQQTVMRVRGDLFTSPTIICNQQHRFLVAEQMQQQGIDELDIILEPMARNTAAAVATAALFAADRFATVRFTNEQADMEGAHDPLILLLPSDHLIEDPESFIEALRSGIKSAVAGNIVIFGVKPIRAETNYGYIETAAHPLIDPDPQIEPGPLRPLTVKGFIEKPDAEMAQQLAETAGYYWNVGIFLSRASTLKSAFQTQAPHIWQNCQNALTNAKQDLDFLRLDKDAFAANQDISFDYAIMEKTNNVTCVPLKTPWSDLGSWTSLWHAEKKDENGNVIKGDVMLHNTENSFAHSKDGASLSLIGMKNVIAVATSDAVMLCDKQSSKHISILLEKLAENGRDEHLHHKCIYRPWGSYETIGEGPRYQVKRLLVKPGASLSLQRHNKRAEHWVVVKGTAEVLCGDQNFILNENQSTYIPIGEIHRLKNPLQTTLEIIEVQSGSYLGEDDIERLEDNYGRSDE